MCTHNMVKYNFEENKYDSSVKRMNTFLYISLWFQLFKGTHFIKIYCHYKSVNEFKSIKCKNFSSTYFMDLNLLTLVQEWSTLFVPKGTLLILIFFFLTVSSLALQSMLCTVVQEHLHG